MTLMTAELIEAVLQTRRLGHPALVFDQVGSTNDVAHQQAHAGAQDGLLVIAEEQTAGRGRLGRAWWAPRGSCLLMSLLIAPSTVSQALPANRAGQLTMCVGLGAVEAITEVTGLEARLKWPNDILFNGRKLGGMLSELSTGENAVAYAVIGLGLNVNVDFVADGAPVEVVRVATSLQTETGRPVDRLALLAVLLSRTERWYERVLDGESPHEAWAQRLDTIGRRVRISFLSSSLEGLAVGATPDGGLLVRDDAGAVQTVWSGDVTALR